jgi:dTDP-4-amino-4,6-dideoxygalactose transaminase
MINVTKANLPPIEVYQAYLEEIWSSHWLTNQGPMVQSLESSLKQFLDVDFLQFVTNGTIAIQIPLRALELEGEVITTPFSYVATTTSLLWERLQPVFADILPDTLCIDPAQIEKCITPKTTAILATHVYGIPCDVERIQSIAKAHNLKVIYDGAHAFGVKYKGKSVFQWGDVSTLSFHATKLFHTVEGGAMICNREDLDKKLYLYKAFGHIGDEYYTMGINGKNSEFHAAMGLANLTLIQEILQGRKRNFEYYQSQLSGLPVTYPIIHADVEYNYAYFPIIFEDERIMLKVKAALQANGVNSRRYFYPSLNQLPYHSGAACPVSEDIASRVLCLPHYQDLTMAEMEMIAKTVRNTFNSNG